MANPNKENDISVPDPPPIGSDEWLDNEARRAADSLNFVQEGRQSSSDEKYQQMARAFDECSAIIYTMFASEIERIYRIISGEIAYVSNWYNNISSIAEQMGVSSVDSFTTLFTGALCSMHNNVAEIDGAGISALKSAMFLSLSFAPEHKMRAQEQQIQSTAEAVRNLLEETEKILDRYKPAAPSHCFDNQSKVALIVVEDYIEDSLQIQSNNSGADEVDNLSTSLNLPTNANLILHNVLERTASDFSDINNNEADELYSSPTIFPRPRITGFSEKFPERYYVEDETSDTNINTLSPVEINQNSAIISGELEQIDNGDNYEALFEWREVGQGGWNTTDVTSLLQPKTFEWTIDGLLTDTEYEYRALVDIYDENVFVERLTGGIFRLYTGTDSISRDFTWTGEGRSIATSLLIEGNSNSPTIKESVVEPVNDEEASISKPDSVTQGDLVLMVDNSHRSNRSLEAPEFEQSHDAQENFEERLPDTRVYSRVATSEEPDEYDLSWSGGEASFIVDHTDNVCHKSLIDKLEELAISLQNYDEEKETEQIEQVGEEVTAMADCLDFVMNRADELLEDDPEKNIREVANIENIEDQLDTIEEAGFNTSAENINLSSMGRFLEQKKNELENMQSPPRDLSEEELFEWGDQEVLADNMKLEFLKEIRDSLEEIRNGLATFKRFIQELSEMPPMVPTDVSIDAIREFVNGLNSELYDIGQFLENSRVDLKIQQADLLGELGGLFEDVDQLGDSLFEGDNIDEATDFLEDADDALEDAQDMFTIIFRFVPYIIFGEDTAEFFDRFENLFGQQPHEKFSVADDLFNDLKDDSQTVDQFYQNDIKTWDGVFTIFTTWFDEDTTAVNAVDEAMYFLTRIIQNLNRVINGEEAIENSEVERFGLKLAEIFGKIRNDIPLEMILGILELYLSLYQMINYFSGDHLEELDENLEAMSEAVSGFSDQLNAEIGRGDFDSFMNREGGLASCLQIVFVSIQEYAAAYAQRLASEGTESASSYLQEITSTIKYLRRTVKKYIPEDLELFELGEICEGQSYAEDLQEDLDELQKRLGQLTSFQVSDAEVANDPSLSEGESGDSGG